MSLEASEDQKTYLSCLIECLSNQSANGLLSCLCSSPVNLQVAAFSF